MLIFKVNSKNNSSCEIIHSFSLEFISVEKLNQIRKNDYNLLLSCIVFLQNMGVLDFTKHPMLCRTKQRPCSVIHSGKLRSLDFSLQISPARFLIMRPSHFH